MLRAAKDPGGPPKKSGAQLQLAKPTGNTSAPAKHQYGLPDQLAGEVVEGMPGCALTAASS